MAERVSRRAFAAWAALAGLGIAAGCASTKMTSTWTDPAAKGSELSKVAVIAMAKDEGLRRMAEDEVAQEIKGAQVVPSYQVLGDTDLQDKEAVKAKLREEGFDGVLVMRMAGASERVVAVDAGPYATFDGYYSWAYGATYGPYVETETVVRMVSNLYSVEQNKLVWSGTSETFDPSSAKDLVDDVSRQVAKELEKDRLVA
jgi:hypothetical protein